MNLTTAPRPDVHGAVDRAQAHGRRLAARERDWLVPLGRAGYAANGLVYLIIGALAAQAALGTGGETTDAGGVLGRIIQAPFGEVALAVVAVGLAGYAVWRMLEALLDTEHKGPQPKGVVERCGYAISAIAYAGLALSAIAMATGRGGQPDEDQATQDRTAWLMSQPFGPWLVVLAGLVVIGVALGQLVLACTGSSERELRTAEMDPSQRRLANVAARLGYAARGVAFGLIGLFLVVAGAQARPDQARGLGGALAGLAEQPYGPWLLGVVAIGLMGYGAHMLIAARYRRMVLD